MQCAEELAGYILHALLIELEVIPRLGVGYHVPAQGIAAELFNLLKRINGITQTLGHLVAVLVQNQTV